MSSLSLINGISIINGAAVGIFGIILSAAFCDIRWTHKKNLLITISMAALLLIQGIVYFFVDSYTVRLLYPVITHIPLAIILCILNKRILWPVISVFTAYLCCYPRRWLALLTTHIFSGNLVIQHTDEIITQNIAELIITIPLIFILLRFVAPGVRSISQYSTSLQFQFGLIPLLGYLFDYITHIYTDLLTNGTPIVVEFMSSVCCIAYLIFVQRTSQEKQIRSQLEHTQNNLNLQITQAVREIELMRNSQQQARLWRHDLRHHMQYLSSCIENNRLEQAQSYIHEICSEIEANTVTVYCENETANLIFSAFAGRAKEYDIPIKIQAELSKNLPVSESDLCVLLSNAFENALHSCQKLKQKGLSGTIEAYTYEKNGKIFFQIINTCDNEVTFDKEIPVTNETGHGIGVRSICALVERYNGIYTFSAQNGQFILRVSL